MIYFNFPGQYTVEFGLLRKNNSPYTKNKQGLINNLSKREVGLAAVLGGYAGYNLGAAYSDIKNPRTIAGRRPSVKGSWKPRLAGAVLAGGIPIAGALLLRKKDKDGRSDKGKKRK